jgi:hypothetical protein
LIANASQLQQRHGGKVLRHDDPNVDPAVLRLGVFVFALLGLRRQREVLLFIDLLDAQESFARLIYARYGLRPERIQWGHAGRTAPGDRPAPSGGRGRLRKSEQAAKHAFDQLLPSDRRKGAKIGWDLVQRGQELRDRWVRFEVAEGGGAAAYELDLSGGLDRFMDRRRESVVTWTRLPGATPRGAQP